MTTYHLSIHKVCSSYSGMDTFTHKELQLENKQDFDRAKRLCENQKNMAGFFKQTVLPIHTDRASDLFFPTLMNLVIKTKELANHFMSVMMAIVWDIATLPIRLVTYFPRMIYNAMTPPSEHPLIPYLKAKGLSSLEVEGVNPVQLHVIDKTIRFLEKEGRVNILLYTKEIKEDREERNGWKYELYLTDKEIAFPTYRESQFGSSSKID